MVSLATSPKMLAACPPSPLSAEPIFIGHPQPKDGLDHLYSSGCSLQVIQLEEISPPPRQPRVATSYTTSSFYSSEYSESSAEDEQEEENAEEVCSSYCSSVEDLPEDYDPANDMAVSSSAHSAASGSVPCPATTKRILAWREDFSASFSALPDFNSSSRTKRKKECEDDDAVSHCSKRSRSDAGDSHCAFGALLSCPACDSQFNGLLSFRLHGSGSQACSAAVQYASESSPSSAALSLPSSSS